MGHPETVEQASRPDGVPDYDELPVLGKLGLPHSWGVLPDLNLGTLAWLTPDRVRDAFASSLTGERISLVLPLAEPDTPLFGRQPFRHELIEIDRNTWDDRLDGFYPQGSTQWDGFLHVRCREYGFYGGRTENPAAGLDAAGIQHWQQGIIGRGVLLDVAGYLADPDEYQDAMSGRTISPADLEATAQRQGTQLKPGDILCLRFGWQHAYRQLGPADRAALGAPGAQLVFDGLSGGADIAEYLWNCRAAAVAADNPAVEVSPGDPARGSLHRRVLSLLGMPLGELFDFDELAVACHARGRWDFVFVSVPIALNGGIGSPGNAVAIM